MKKEFKMSRERFEELQKELNYLKTTRSDEVAEMIKVARGELEGSLLHAVILEEGDLPTGQVTIGTTVTVTAVKGGASRTFKIAGSQEADAMHGVISEDSPFGKALMGAREGQVVTVAAPAGDMQYTVEKIER